MVGFATQYLKDPGKVGAGEIHSVDYVAMGSRSFEDGLKFGLFCKLDNGRHDNLDGSAAPVIAGLVVRNPANKYEDGAAIDADLYTNAVLLQFGYATVDVKAGQTPAYGQPVFASNAGDADDGKALAVPGASGVPTGATFVEQIDTNVWLVFIDVKRPATDLYALAYTVATVPAAASFTGRVIYVSDGAAGNPTLARSDGANWKRLDGAGGNIAAA